jgi:hypothetical protein
MPLNTKQRFLISPELWNQFDLTAPPRRHAANFRGAAIP